MEIKCANEIFTSLPKKLKPFYEMELYNYKINYSNGNLKSAWNHLERAHIIGQKYPYSHTFGHWKMLQFGIRIKSAK
jgi:hypothetical protein